MAFYPEFANEPSKPHQCIHVNTEGVRCRSYAMRNKYTCFHHQSPDIHDVFSNDAFPLEHAQTRVSIQSSIAEVLQRIAANQMDLKRAAILLYGLQIASSNLRDAIPAQPAATPAGADTSAPAPVTIPWWKYIPSDTPSPTSTANDAAASQPNQKPVGHESAPQVDPKIDQEPVPESDDESVPDIRRNFSPGTNGTQPTQASAPGKYPPNSPAQNLTLPTPEASPGAARRPASGLSTAPEDEADPAAHPGRIPTLHASSFHPYASFAHRARCRHTKENLPHGGRFSKPSGKPATTSSRRRQPSFPYSVR